MHIFHRIFLSNYWWQESDIWSQASYRYAILWEAYLDPSDSYLLFADLVGFYTHWTYMHIFRHILLSYYWWQRSDIWSQASYRYPISWEAFVDPSDSYFLFAEKRGYHKWDLAHSLSCSMSLSTKGTRIKQIIHWKIILSSTLLSKLPIRCPLLSSHMYLKVKCTCPVINKFI
jgi:hypothetical protein